VENGRRETSPFCHFHTQRMLLLFILLSGVPELLPPPPQCWPSTKISPKLSGWPGMGWPIREGTLCLGVAGGGDSSHRPTEVKCLWLLETGACGSRFGVPSICSVPASDAQPLPTAPKDKSLCWKEVRLMYTRTTPWVSCEGQPERQIYVFQQRLHYTIKILCFARC
jgi:hypothetical protein